MIVLSVECLGTFKGKLIEEDLQKLVSTIKKKSGYIQEHEISWLLYCTT